MTYDDEGRVAGFLAGSRVIDAAHQIVLRNQSSRIEQLEQENAEQEETIQQLKTLVCEDHPDAEVCR